MENREYVGKNIKLGFMHTFMPGPGGMEPKAPRTISKTACGSIGITSTKNRIEI